ncbi:MAG: TolC family protein [Acidobacteriota bacterium]
MPSLRLIPALVAVVGSGGLPAQVWTERAVLELFESQTAVKKEIRASVAATVEELRGRALYANPRAVYAREAAGLTEFYQAEQALPVSGRIGYLRRAAAFGQEAGEADGAARLWDLRSSLRQAYYRTLAMQLLDEIFTGSIAEVERIARIVRVREETGESSRYDRLRLERELAELRTDRLATRARFEQERAVLLAFLPRGARIDRLEDSIQPATLRDSLDELVRLALDQRAEFRAGARRLDQLRAEQQAAERLRVPEPVLAAGLKRAEVLPNRIGHGVAFAISVPLPVFNRGRTEVARLTAEQERARARLELVAQQVSASVEGVYRTYEARRKAWLDFRDQAAAMSPDLLRMAAAGYQEGELGILELLDAYRVSRTARFRLADLGASVKEAEIELSRAVGTEVTR